MANQTLTPRQKMINMMYLVLIALLALNVSREILKSFYLFELSFHEANKQIGVRNTETMKRFGDRMQNDKTRKRTEEWFLLAEKAERISADFYRDVETMKSAIIRQGGGREPVQPGGQALSELKKPDDMETHAHYFIESGKGQGKVLQKRINDTREQLAALVSNARNGERIRQSLLKASQLKATDPPSDGLNKKTWVSAYLEHAPLAGVVTLLTKMQNDCKALEAEVLNVLSENINIESITSDGQMALILPESQTVLSGGVFRARIALATYDTKSSPQMFVNGKPVVVKDGFGEISIPASGTGTHKIEASIESIDPKTGEPVLLASKPLEWQSYQASATISADNMNVLFIGLDNPMSISVPGITPANTVVSADNGIRIENLGSGKFIARVSAGSQSGKVLVSARMPDGSLKRMGEMVYRIRKVPEPKLRFGNLTAGTHEKSTLKVQQYLYAVLEDFYFKGVLFKVQKFRANLISKRNNTAPEFRGSGNALAGLQSLISSAQSGDILYIDEILVKGPSGDVRPEPITIKIK